MSGDNITKFNFGILYTRKIIAIGILWPAITYLSLSYKDETGSQTELSKHTYNCLAIDIHILGVVANQTVIRDWFTTIIQVHRVFLHKKSALLQGIIQINTIQYMIVPADFGLGNPSDS